MNLGEKLETIIFSRKSGDLGNYLGSSAETFGAAEIEGVIYKITRNIETVGDFFWTVLNVNTGNIVRLKDKYDLPCLKFV
jgi:hypothetical protein